MSSHWLLEGWKALLTAMQQPFESDEGSQIFRCAILLIGKVIFGWHGRNYAWLSILMDIVMVK